MIFVSVDTPARKDLVHGLSCRFMGSCVCTHTHVNYAIIRLGHSQLQQDKTLICDLILNRKQEYFMQ